MAFQGKGIFGNIKGKVGNVVGYEKNGKGIIQSIGKRTGNVKNFSWQYVNQLMVDPSNVDVGNYYVFAKSTNFDFSDGARTREALTVKNGGIEFENSISNNNGMMSLGNGLSDYSYVNQQYSIQCRNTQYFIFENGVFVMVANGLFIGQKFRIVLEFGKVNYYRTDASGKWILFYQSSLEPVFPLYGVAGMRSSTCKFVNIKFGGTSLIST